MGKMQEKGLEKVKVGKELTTLEQLIIMCGETNKGYFVRWYCDSDENREPYDIYSKKFLNNRAIDTCMNWLQIQQVQKAIKWYMKVLYVQDMLNLYKKMYSKALSGDVNCANWCVKFAESDFFKDKENELEEFLVNVNVDIDGGGLNG